MILVKFASLCDAPDCLKRSEEYGNWPTCRNCHLDTCPDHTVPGSLQEHEYDRDDEAVMKQDVYCTACLATWGAE